MKLHLPDRLKPGQAHCGTTLRTANQTDWYSANSLSRDIREMIVCKNCYRTEEATQRIREEARR